MLREAGYEARRIGNALGINSDLTLAAAAALSELRADRLATLGALFLAGDTVPERAATVAIAPLAPDALEAAGVFERVPEGIRALVRIEEYEGLLLTGDRDDAHPADDYVLEVGPSTRQAAALTVRVPVERGLDLCSGSGIQALRLRGHAANVVGTDLSQRAVGFARFNAALNSVDGIDWRLGDLLEPVEGERFGVVVCNPPFVIGPGGEPLYRDGRSPADELSQAVATGVAGTLEEGGFATIMCNWISRAGEQWYEPPERWLEGAGCDVLVVQFAVEGALDYAAGWSSLVLPRDGGTAYVATVEGHREYLRQLGAETITAGVLVLRRRQGVNWRRREITRMGPQGSASDQLVRIFEAEDFLAGLQDERRLLDAVLEPAPGARVVRSARYEAGRYEPRVAQVALDDRIGLAGRIPAAALPALEQLDGRKALREVLGETAGETLPAMRELLARGFLRRV
jgi:methylase of polypeptide subunit release factors